MCLKRSRGQTCIEGARLVKQEALMESSLPTGRPVFARFKDLTDGGAADLPATFQTMASLLEDAGFDVVIEFHIRRGDVFHTYSLRVEEAKSSSTAEPASDAHVTILTAEETWAEIAAGRLSPLDAFGDGLLRLRGDMVLGSRVLKHLAGTPGRVEIC
jgi:putative sterol carrier protein